MSVDSELTRAGLPQAHRIVVKVGSSSLTEGGGSLDVAALRALVEVFAARRRSGGQVVLVSSGAIAAGIAPLGLSSRPRDLATQQAAASVGQGLLMAHYTQAFAQHGLRVAQVLLTAEDVVRRGQYKNAQRALERLLALGVVPIINENDAVATDEIRFGDNDRLAALVSHVVQADALVLLTDVDALYDAPPASPLARRIARVRTARELDEVAVTGRGSGVGTGGMVTKVEAAAIATGAGIPTLVAAASQAGRALDGDDVGTWFDARGRRIRTRRLWLAHAAHTRGRLQLDDGAVRAITHGKRSLLAAGVTGVEGHFEPGDPVDLVAPTGEIVARGLVAYSSEELPERLGRSSHELRELFGDGHNRTVVHRDDLVVVHRRA
ncbi:glutamate 5-kinase [Beutenbergia cavernae DSM 12333]|uniref:Glutamate 5-kinase n=1 Tax=Beutenbergia cavernae (strain ATCC BAA-8 / DSM 12333 / CCUG 43141 / JCM 11478 / NBRC 16432 / NCIMB 13614 / HKI 0122) TaxID=471853 RepID=C5C3W8_BEUC1|nr:glutamate 5-kinase [Beutenbergia cavernae]ACQ79881.1 glutamate 5-kinase [Beutenbergia cavernae DSM 12333]